jgi:hypothetical protein
MPEERACMHTECATPKVTWRAQKSYPDAQTANSYRDTHCLDCFHTGKHNETFNTKPELDGVHKRTNRQKLTHVMQQTPSSLKATHAKLLTRI